MKPRQNVERFKVTPVNLVNNAKAPYYVFEYQKNGNLDLKKSAIQEAKNSTRLSSFEVYDFEVEKL